MPQPWYSIRARGPRAEDSNSPKSAEVFIFGDIGESWWDETIAARDFVREFAAIDAEQVTVRINSVGGSVHDGVAIHNAIKRHAAKVTTSIEGVAYSIASLIAMAGDTVEMAENALFMVHAPMTGTFGNSALHREQADMLDQYAQAMSSSYMAKTGKSAEEIMALLTDGKDHFYTAQEALDAGFVDSVVTALPIAASARAMAEKHPRYQAPLAAANTPKPAPTAAPAAHQPKETEMPGDAQPQAVQKTQAENLNAQILKDDLARREAVRAEFRPFAGNTEILAIEKACEDDHECTPEMAAKKILAVMAKNVKPVGAAHIETVEDEADKRRDSIVNALLARAGVNDPAIRAAARASQYRGATLLDIAKASLDRAGVRYGQMDSMQVVGMAFTQSTSDFPVLLENAMHKALQMAYAVAPDTWSRFCARGSVSDFREHPRYRVGSIGNLEKVNENGEFRTKNIPDGEKASVQADTKGNVINLSRKMVVNDDLGAFIGLAQMLGRAARRTIEADVYLLLAENSGLGPTMEDGQTLFHATHGNIGTGAAIAVEALDADRVLMASQLDVGGNDFLDLRPAVLLVPIGLGGKARVINEAQYDPDTANKLQRPNQVAGLFRDIVDTPRMSGTRRYLFADPSEAPVIEVSFLNGEDMPFLEQQEGFSVDGTSWKVRLDYGVGAVDYRGAVTNAGG